MIPSRWALPLGGIVLGLVLGLGAGWRLWHPKAAPQEGWAPSQKLPGGGLVLERRPDPEARPAQPVPAGAKVERVVQVTVQPRPLPAIPFPTAAPGTPTSGADLPPAPGRECPPVRVDLTLVRLKDQTRRVLASSPDGEVVGGLDVPVESAQAPQELRWAAGAIYGATSAGGRSTGAFLHRDAGPLRLGVEVTRDTVPGVRSEWAGRALVGLRF